MSYLGAPVRRREDRPLLIGAGRYVDDIRLPGMLHLALLRSPPAHARIRTVDAARVLLLSGVTAVITAAELGRPFRVSPSDPCFPIWMGSATRCWPMGSPDTSGSLLPPCWRVIGTWPKMESTACVR